MPGRVLLGCNARRRENTGVAGTLLAEGAELAARGWDVHYVFGSSSARRSARVDRQLTYGRVATVVRRLRPDVAVVSSGDGYLVPWAAPSVPLVVQSHGLEHLSRWLAEASGVDGGSFGWGHRLVRERAVAGAMSRAEAVVVKNATEAAIAREEIGVDAGRVHVIANGVEEAFLTVGHRPAARPTVAWIASWIERKGAGLLPAVVDAVRIEVPDVVFHLIGCRTPEARVRAAFAPDAQANVRLTVDTTRDGVAAACAEAWVGLSTSYFEGFGKNVIEMLATGLPVVATPAGVAFDVIDDHRTGALVDHDVPRISAALVGLLRDGDRRDAMAGQCRRVASHYRWPTIGASWHDLLSAVVRRGAGAPAGATHRHRACTG